MEQLFIILGAVSTAGINERLSKDERDINGLFTLLSSSHESDFSGSLFNSRRVRSEKTVSLEKSSESSIADFSVDCITGWWYQPKKF